MKPRQTKTVPQKDLFQPQLVDIINPSHPLVRLAKVIDWNQLDNELGGTLLNGGCRRVTHSPYGGIAVFATLA